MTPAERRNYVEGTMFLLHSLSKDGVLMSQVATQRPYLSVLNLEDAVILQRLIGKNINHHHGDFRLRRILRQSYARVEAFLKKANTKAPLKRKLEQNPRVRFSYREAYL